METAEKPRESGKGSGEQEGEKKEERPKLNIEKVQKIDFATIADFPWLIPKLW